MGAYKFYNPTTQKWEIIKSKSIVKPDGSLEYTPDDIKNIEDNLAAHKADLMLHTKTVTGTLTVSTDAQNEEIKLGFRPKYVKMLIETLAGTNIVEFIDGSIYGFMHTNSSTGTTHERFLKKDLGAGITDDGFYYSVASGTQLEYIAIG